MLMYKIIIKQKAEKVLLKYDKILLKNIINTLENLSLEPRPVGSIKLVKEEGYRVRVGKYRILYTIDGMTKTIFIYRISHRKDSY